MIEKTHELKESTNIAREVSNRIDKLPVLVQIRVGTFILELKNSKNKDSQLQGIITEILNTIKEYIVDPQKSHQLKLYSLLAQMGSCDYEAYKRERGKTTNFYGTPLVKAVQIHTYQALGVPTDHGDWVPYRDGFIWGMMTILSFDKDEAMLVHEFSSNYI